MRLPVLFAALLCAAVSASAAEPLVWFDLGACLKTLPEDTVLRHDAMNYVASLQGLVNRDGPRLALRFLEVEGAAGTINLDEYYLDLLREDWLKDAEVIPEADLEALLRRFSGVPQGAVLWDPAVPATMNVAATVCGVEGWLPVRRGGTFEAWLTTRGLLPPVRLDLSGRFTGAESGSAKCDAYLWAKHQYLDTGKCNPSLMAYYLDGYSTAPDRPEAAYPDLPNRGLLNRDFYTARKAFFFDLGVWADETPVDDPGQRPGTDRETLMALLRAQHARNGGKAFTSVGGFIPWDTKYTNHGVAGGTHEPVPTEWEYAAILSSFNAIMDADALGLVCLPNASAWGHFPPAPAEEDGGVLSCAKGVCGRPAAGAAYEQNPRPERRPLEEKTYVLVYMGDYDSAAWLARSMPRLWDDPARGRIPIAWAFNPNLAERVPWVFDHVLRTKSPNDWFIGGDSGAGYLNPNLLLAERRDNGLPDALDLWVEHNRRWYDRFSYSITGFVINGFHGKMPLRVQEAYAKFSPDGVGMQLGYEKPLVDGVPFLRHVSDIYPDGANLEKAAAQMASFAREGKPRFLIFRWILQSPSTLEKVAAIMVEKYPEHAFEFCDPHTFFDLYRQSLEKR